MSASTLPSGAFFAFMAGRHKSFRDNWMLRARDTKYPEIKQDAIRYARDNHRDMMNYLTLARKHLGDHR